MAMRENKRLIKLRTLLGIVFLFAFTLPVVISSVFFWQHVSQSRQQQEQHLAMSFGSTLEEILRVKLEEYIDLFQGCSNQTYGISRLERSTLVYCGERSGDLAPHAIFQKITHSDALSAESLVKSVWWSKLRATKTPKIIFEAATGIQAAYYKKFILIYRGTPERMYFALFDPLALASTVQSSIDGLGKISTLSPILTNPSGQILFAPQAVFYRAFFTDKSFSKMLAENPEYKEQDYTAPFEIDGNNFKLHFLRPFSSHVKSMTGFYNLLIFVCGLNALLGIVGVFVVLRYISDPVVSLSIDLVKLGRSLSRENSEGVSDFVTSPTQISELDELQGGIGFLVNSIRERDLNLGQLNEALRKNELLAQIGKVTSQIAHDIRSPLTALKVSLGFVSKLPEQERLIIRSAVQRIEDIANTLGTAARERSARGEVDRVCLLTSLLEPIITEKRLQYRSILNLNIQLKFGENAYGLFAKINANDFRCALSNLISNAVEASEHRANAQVEIIVNAAQANCEITVCDNGHGIPEELIHQIGVRGFTFQKKNGSGLGVSHAKEILESWGGSLNYKSQRNHGTRAVLSIPSSPSPAWFVPRLDIQSGMVIGILDDDISIHQVWQRRLQRFNDRISIVAFSEIAQVERYLPTLKCNSLFLFDYELVSQPATGLDLIRKWNLENRAILVTSHFDDRDFIKECAALGIKILPKSLASKVPIQFLENFGKEESREIKLAN
jgi:signal transduction histidine kinase